MEEKHKFTEDEIYLLKGSYTRLAKKHDCDPGYVKKIAEGDRETNTDKAKAIYLSLEELLTVLKPS